MLFSLSLAINVCLPVVDFGLLGLEGTRLLEPRHARLPTDGAARRRAELRRGRGRAFVAFLLGLDRAAWLRAELRRGRGRAFVAFFTFVDFCYF